MTRRRLAVGLVSVIAVLLAGRALSSAYAGYTWYESNGARSIWVERVTDTALLQSCGFLFAALFVFFNLASARRSIHGIARPRRIANVEFLEQVPGSQLKWSAIILSAGSAAAMTRILPPWTSVAMARLGAEFGEKDPYLQHDISFYTGWLPVEAAIHSWAIVLVVFVSVMVVTLYAFTGGVRWQHGLLEMTVSVRRHLGILSSLTLVLAAWSYRLDSYELVSGARASGFDTIAHHWMLPALLALGIGTLACAMTVALSAWAGQLRTSVIAIMIAIALAALVKEVIPFILRRAQPPDVRASELTPYLATRQAFTQRAFSGGIDEEPPAEMLTAPSPATGARDTTVRPGANGIVILDDPTADVAGPSLGRGLVRLAHAWSERNFALLSDSIRRRARIVTVRDVGSRVGKRFPLFTAGPAALPLFRGDTLFWAVPLYASSASYPLAAQRRILGEPRSYFRRAGTAFVNARSARMWAVFDPPADPIAAAWIRRFETARSAHDAEAVRSSLRAITADIPPATADTSFKAGVERLYDRMRTALASGDLRSFSLAYDSLGALVERSRKR